MKITVQNPESKVKLINWDTPCLVQSANAGCLVLTTGCHSSNFFQGFDLNSAEYKFSDWVKGRFVLFKGHVSLEND